MTNLIARGGAELRQVWEAHGLTCAALHGFYRDFANTASRGNMLEFAIASSTPRLICSGVGEQSSLGYEQAAALFNEIGEQCRMLGLRFYYHNHEKEFAILQDYQRGIDILEQQTLPSLVYFNIDVYWAMMGGEDPATLIHRLADRSGYYHFKDGRGERNVPLGQGTVDLPSAFKAACSHSIEWIIIEQDNPGHSSFESCEISRAYLRSLGIE